MNTYQKGIWSERFAALYLMCKGYSILEMRYKTKFGEVDIIARKGSYIVFTEVKYRPDYDRGAFSISSVAKKRIAKAASHYLMVKGHEAEDVRFDALILSPPFYIRHIKNAWTI